MRWTLHFAFALPLLAGCGDDPFANLVDQVESDLIFATVEQISQEKVVEGSYIVNFKGHADEYLQLNHGSYLSEFRFHYQYLTELYYSDPRVKDLRYIHALDMGALDRPDEEFGMPGWWLSRLTQSDEPAIGALTEVTFHSNEEAKQALTEWHQQGRIWFADPNYLSRLSEGDFEGGLSQEGIFQNFASEYEAAGTNPKLWWHGKIKLVQAFQAMASRDLTSSPSDSEILGASPVIAVLDSGLDVDHPAFEDRLFVNTSPGIAGCAGDVNGCDTTEPQKGELGNGKVTPFAYDGTVCPTEKSDNKNCQHGTHVGGIIASKLNTAEGYGGVCPVCRLMPIKIISGPKGKGAAKDSAIINGMVYLSRFAKKSDQSALVRVANSSFGKYSRSRAVALMVSVLSKAPQELLVIGAASNEDSMLRAYPAAFNNAIAVSALDPFDRKATYSNFGPWVDVAAPGGGRSEFEAIWSPVPGNTSIWKQGTSMAAPVVAGVAGLILAVDPKRSFNNMRKSIIDTADGRIYTNSGDTVFNQSYYVDIGVSVRQPLLGSGAVDAPAAIAGTAKTGVSVSALSRVERGCGAVASGSPTGGIWLLILPAFLPLIWFGSHLILRRNRL